MPIRYCSFLSSTKGSLPASVSFSSEFWELLDQQFMLEIALRQFFTLGMLLGTDGSVNPPANFPMRIWRLASSQKEAFLSITWTPAGFGHKKMGVGRETRAMSDNC